MKKTRKRKPDFIGLDNYEPRDAKFLWEPYIPLRELTIIEGDPGLGKSTMVLAIAAAVSRGHPLPGQTIGNIGKVMSLSAEDDPNITLRPRIDASVEDPL